MRSLHTYFLSLGVILSGSGVALAGEPSSSYCEAGMRYENIDSSVTEISNSLVDTTSLSGRFEDGFGFGGGCRVEAYKKFYIFGDFSRASIDLRRSSETVGSVVIPPIETTRKDGESTRWRIGVGYQQPIALGLAAYGQAGVGRLSFRSDGEVDFCGIAGCDLVSGPVKARRTNIDAEAGIRWLILPALELGAFAHYDGAGAIDAAGLETSFHPGPITAQETFIVSPAGKDDFRVGLNAAVRIADPVWISGRYEFGENDVAFAGVRIAF